MVMLDAVAVHAVDDKAAGIRFRGVHRKGREIILGRCMRGSVDAAEMVLAVDDLAEKHVGLPRLEGGHDLEPSGIPTFPFPEVEHFPGDGIDDLQRLERMGRGLPARLPARGTRRCRQREDVAVAALQHGRLRRRPIGRAAR